VTRGSLAITGGTGFVGATLIRLAVEAGWSVNALTRRAQLPQTGVTWVAGSLETPEALTALISCADAVIHVAGITNTPTREAFIAGNVTGTEAVIAACLAQDVQRFVHVSSLTARAPGLSNYGWSKAEAEKRVMDSPLGWTIIRPPAVFGPGDTDHLDLFKAALWHIMPLPPGGCLSVIEVSDLARLLLAAVSDLGSVGHLYEADDGRDFGWTHTAYARAIGAAVGKWVLPLPVPAPIIGLGAGFDRMLRGDRAKLTADRAAYFCHPDWVIDPKCRPPARLWTPIVETSQGLTDTAKAYRAAGWL
jgi:nucleoside-diphosphate-sugar epimerase